MDVCKIKMVPDIFSRGGACLTHQNWKDVGIDTIFCSLEQLLFKPGLDFIWELPNLASWLAWDGAIVLNADIPLVKNTNTHKVFSPWDGSSISLTTETLSDLIKHLKPDYVILPDTLLEHASLGWPDPRFPLSPFIKTDKPADDGFNGLVYTANETIDLKENIFEFQTIPIEKTCLCTICTQMFTRAYLHHLYLHTPLLAQRLLIMHNVYWWKKVIE